MKKPLKFKKVHNYTFNGVPYKIRYTKKKWKDGSFGECDDRAYGGNCEIRICLGNINNNEKILLSTICDEICHAVLGHSLANEQVDIFSDQLSDVLFQMGWRLPEIKEDLSKD